jgi:MFS family permease
MALQGNAPDPGESFHDDRRTCVDGVGTRSHVPGNIRGDPGHITRESGLHAIRERLHTTPVLQRVIDLYNVVYAALILTGGALGDLYGHKRIFLLGGALFALGSVVCGLAPNAGVLIAGRGITGLGAALELPTALSILNVSYPDSRRRAGAIAIWGGMNGLAMAIGPTLGGVLIDLLGWRSLF